MKPCRDVIADKKAGSKVNFSSVLESRTSVARRAPPGQSDSLISTPALKLEALTSYSQMPHITGAINRIYIHTRLWN